MITQTRRSHLAILAAGASLLAARPAEAVEPKDYVGTWSGLLDNGQLRLRILIHIDTETQARFVGLDQGAGQFFATAVNLAPDSVSIEFGELKETFAGRLRDSNTLQLRSALWDMTVDFVRGNLWPPKIIQADTLQTIRRNSGAPAMGVAYAKASGPATTLMDGLRSSDEIVAAQANDRWHLGSITKSMTATLTARLVEAGRISWTTTVDELLAPSLPEILDAYKRANFRHLLSHHAGLQPNIADADFVSFSRDNLDDAREERLRYAGFALKQQPINELGKAGRYANNGYIVAGAMLEAACGMSWETLMRTHVFEPLGLASGGFGPPGALGQIDQPLGHLTPGDGGKLVPGQPGGGKPIDNPVALGPAGRVHMSLPDLIAFLRAHLTRPEAFLSQANWSVLHTPPFTGAYALGWDVEGDVLAHGGSTPRWQARAGFDRKNGVVAAVAANASTQVIMGAVADLHRDAMLTATL